MHMADALISPLVGGVMWSLSAGILGYSIKKVQKELNHNKVPLMAVMGAFVFAAQMINFAIPLTGSSGHIGGGILLAILLGPYAGFLTMASVLMIQALFFADGGLLALGCNLFNLGFFTCFIAYPLVYEALVSKRFSQKGILIASLLTSIIGLQLGSLGVVLETFLSGKTELPLGSFLLLMQPIHLAIGIIEGLVTAAILSYIYTERRELLERKSPSGIIKGISLRKVLLILMVAALVLGGILSSFASEKPDGLEWAIFHTSGKEELGSPQGIHEVFSNLQEKTAVLPEYDFKTTSEAPSRIINRGTSLAGVGGGLLTLLLISLFGYLLYVYKQRKKNI